MTRDEANTYVWLLENSLRNKRITLIVLGSDEKFISSRVGELTNASANCIMGDPNKAVVSATLKVYGQSENWSLVSFGYHEDGGTLTARVSKGLNDPTEDMILHFKLIPDMK